MNIEDNLSKVYDILLHVCRLCDVGDARVRETEVKKLIIPLWE